MKNRITFVAENSRPLRMDKDPKVVEKAVELGWQYLLEMLCFNPDDKVTIEKVEVFE